MKYEQLVSMIIEKIGGKENVNSVVHCTTRLRFKLKDEKKQIQSFLKRRMVLSLLYKVAVSTKS